MRCELVASPFPPFIKGLNWLTYFWGLELKRYSRDLVKWIQTQLFIYTVSGSQSWV